MSQIDNAQRNISKKRKVLLVDDDEDSIFLHRQILTRAGIEVESVRDGKDALPVTKSFGPDLILMDVEMPGMNGIETLRELRQLETYVAVIMISSHQDPKTIVRSLHEGADDYIIKPFNPEELTARVQVRFRIKDMHDRLIELNQTDEITGLFNMRSMMDRIAREMKRAHRYQSHIACVMMDIDKFKKVNDHHSHLMGTHVLQKIGKIIQDSLRAENFAARFGGDEFLIVIVEANPQGVQIYLDRILKKIAEYVFEYEGDTVQVTMSAGGAFSDWGSLNETPKKVIALADQALYQSKAKGGNQLSLHDESWRAHHDVLKEDSESKK